MITQIKDNSNALVPTFLDKISCADRFNQFIYTKTVDNSRAGSNIYGISTYKYTNLYLQDS